MAKELHFLYWGMKSLDLAGIQTQLGKKIITRFAPSPTGHLHLGHVVNAIFVWGLAGKLGGSVLLRIEDHDRGRYRPEYENSILDDLEWLGFFPDLNTIQEFREGATPFRQSNNQSSYRNALTQLREHQHIYACDCSRKQIVARTGQEGGELKYDGFCRDRGLREGKGKNLRLGWEGGAESFEDLLLGAQTQHPDLQCGDIQLIDKQGQWSYQFAVTVDDWQQEVNLVIRGEDILSSTGRQIRLARLLGRTEPPLFLHHPLLLDPQGRKLSKRQLSEGINQSRKKGIPPEEVIGAAALGCGLIAEARPVSVQEVAALF